MKGKRILVVDDEESTAFFLGESLSELGPGYQVETAGSGEEAIYKIAVQPFDLVVTDLRMPGLSGLDLLKWIRKTSPETRLILMTAYGSDDVETQARRLEVSRYIIKPFRVGDLIDAVRQAVSGIAISRKGILVLSDARFEAVTHRLDQLRAEIGAQCILLADIMGQLVTHVGITSGLEVNTLISLIGGGFATTFEMARYLRQEQSFNLNYQEGERYDVYTSSVGDNLFLTILYDKVGPGSRIGLVWLYTRRAINDLLVITSSAEMEGADDLLSADFKSSLQRELDTIFGESGSDLAALTEQLEQAAPPVETPARSIPEGSRPPVRQPRTEPSPRARPTAAPARPAPKPAVTPASQPAPKPSAAPARRPAKKPTAASARPAPKPVVTPAPQPARKPAAAPAQRPARKPSAAPARPAARARPAHPAPSSGATNGGGGVAATTGQPLSTPARRDEEKVTYSLEEACRMGLIDEELLHRLTGRKDDRDAA